MRGLIVRSLDAKRVLMNLNLIIITSQKYIPNHKLCHRTVLTNHSLKESSHRPRKWFSLLIFLNRRDGELMDFTISICTKNKFYFLLARSNERFVRKKFIFYRVLHYNFVEISDCLKPNTRLSIIEWWKVSLIFFNVGQDLFKHSIDYNISC